MKSIDLKATTEVVYEVIHVLGNQMQNASFIEICFTSKTDFIVVWYSVTNNGLLSQNQFNYQGNVINVSHV
jgi:hypothetical protein